jgi:hypothetical protein
MAKSIQILRLTSAKTTYSGQLQTAVQQHHRPPIFMVPVGWQCQGGATAAKVSKFEC